MADGRCHICLVDGQIVRHHITYFPEKTIPVCKNCHWKIHKENKKYGLSDFKPPTNHAWCFYHGLTPMTNEEIKQKKKERLKKEKQVDKKEHELWLMFLKNEKFSEPIDVCLLNRFKQMKQSLNPIKLVK